MEASVTCFSPSDFTCAARRPATEPPLALKATREGMVGRPRGAPDGHFGPLKLLDSIEKPTKNLQKPSKPLPFEGSWRWDDHETAIRAAHGHCGVRRAHV